MTKTVRAYKAMDLSHPFFPFPLPPASMANKKRIVKENLAPSFAIICIVALEFAEFRRRNEADAAAGRLSQKYPADLFHVI